MSAMSRRKGANAENEVVKYLRGNGFPYAERRLTGSDDPYGDVTGIPGVVIEVKNHATLDLGTWVAQLEDELHHTKADVGAVIHKRKGRTNVGEWYATLPAAVLARLLVEAGYGRADEVAEYQAKIRQINAERIAMRDGAA